MKKNPENEIPDTQNFDITVYYSMEDFEPKNYQ
jgi:hypothetical protein